ncbi:hypothetical protein CPB84DRAFT_1018885 [Gymnopilus junonius]|uniref:DUF6533 domain-containing protein n=1 Tax=Gymnopilus junonius TaxID=109634 RepID=A0A9P5NKU4_GYMJU|nr:hypothetical protein CPB84DRAFT_1018885 [Gymnopilus junonius]
MATTMGYQDYSCLSAFVLLVWDTFDALPDEILLMWRSPMSPSKLAYLFIRYFGLLSLLGNYVLAQQLFSHFPVARSACAGWYALGLVTFWALYASCDLLLMSKVYELYDQSSRVAVFLFSLHFVEALVVSVCSWYSLKVLKFGNYCNGNRIPDGVVVIVTVIILSQIILWTLVVRKKNMWKGPNQNTLKEFFQDERWPWYLTLAALLVLIPAGVMCQFILPYLFFSWPSTMLSVGVRSHTGYSSVLPLIFLADMSPIIE